MKGKKGVEDDGGMTVPHDHLVAAAGSSTFSFGGPPGGFAKYHLSVSSSYVPMGLWFAVIPIPPLRVGTRNVSGVEGIDLTIIGSKSKNGHAGPQVACGIVKVPTEFSRSGVQQTSK